MARFYDHDKDQGNAVQDQERGWRRKGQAHLKQDQGWVWTATSYAKVINFTTIVLNIFMKNQHVQGDPEGLGLGYVDLDFGSSLGWWSATIATYCPRRRMKHLILISTQLRSETFWVTL